MHAHTLLIVTSISLFSPVPKRVMDGSEPSEVVAAAVLSGAPTDLQARTVRYRSTRPWFPIDDTYSLLTFVPSQNIS